MTETLHIYAEENPNPETLKIHVGKSILDHGFLEYPDIESAENSPLAKLFFHYNFTKSIYISVGFFTLEKKPEFAWQDIHMEIKDGVNRWLDSGLPASYDKPLLQVSDDPIISSIIEVLEDKIRPAVEHDGGGLKILSFSEGTLILEPAGSCKGCPHIGYTITSGVEKIIQSRVPEVLKVRTPNMPE
jgi:hypothetical protein